MTTKEVEQLCGITKASLLYYEKEGLIHPDRKDNNYRDYNDKDIEILDFILMMRSMDISIDDIKMIFSGQLSIRDALDSKQEYLKNEHMRLKDIETHIQQYIKRREVKISFDHQIIPGYAKEWTLFFNKDSMCFQDVNIQLNDITLIRLSMCSSTYTINLLKTFMNYYVDIDIMTQKDTYSYQIMNDNQIITLFDYFNKHQLPIEDQLNLRELYYHKQDPVLRNKYLDLHFKEWAQKYHLDNPRNSYMHDNFKRFEYQPINPQSQIREELKEITNTIKHLLKK